MIMGLFIHKNPKAEAESSYVGPQGYCERIKNVLSVLLVIYDFYILSSEPNF